MTTLPSMPIEVARPPAVGAPVVVRMAPFAIAWRAHGERGEATLHMHIHGVGVDQAEVSAEVIQHGQRRPLIDRSWMPAVVRSDEEFIHIDVSLPAGLVAAGVSAEMCGGDLLRISLTRECRPVYVRSQLPALAGFAAGRFEPPVIERMRG